MAGGRGTKATANSRQSTKVEKTKWKAKATHFKHTTYARRDGKGGWVREATKDKPGASISTRKLTGKLGTSKIKGERLRFLETRASDLVTRSADGKVRRTMHVVNTETERRTTETVMQPENIVRKTSSWIAGNTRMTVTRDYRANNNGSIRAMSTIGRPLSVHRTGKKARTKQEPAR